MRSDVLMILLNITDRLVVVFEGPSCPLISTGGVNAQSGSPFGARLWGAHKGMPVLGLWRTGLPLGCAAVLLGCRFRVGASLPGPPRIGPGSHTREHPRCREQWFAIHRRSRVLMSPVMKSPSRSPLQSPRSPLSADTGERVGPGVGGGVRRAVRLSHQAISVRERAPRGSHAKREQGVGSPRQGKVP